MNTKQDLEKQVMMAARDNGISSVLFRNATGRKLGLTSADSECLSFITIKGTATPTQIARYTGLTTGSITAMLDRLEKVAFIIRKPNPDDRRGVLVEINPHYQSLAGPLVAGVQKAHWELLASYSEKELETIVDFLKRFTKNVTDQTKEIENM